MSNKPKTYDERIRAEADKALASIPAEHIEEAKALRQRVYAWLEDVASRCKDTGKTLPESVEAQYGLPLQPLQDVVRSTWTTASIVSRMEDDLVWTPTSFFYDPDTLALNVKIGTNPYQPFAYDDGEKMVQLTTAKLLWARRWGTAIVAPIAPPFDVVPNKAAAEVFQAKAFLSDTDLKGIDKVLEELGEELQSFITDKKEDGEYRLRETLKLARLWSPTLDAQLKLVLRERSGLGPNFENTKIEDVAKASLEYLAMRKDAHLAAVKEAQITLRLSDMTAPTRAQLAYDVMQLRTILTGDAIVIDTLTNLIKRISAAYNVEEATTPLYADGKTPDAIALATAIYNMLAVRLSIGAYFPVGTDDGSASTAQPGDAGSPGSAG